MIPTGQAASDVNVETDRIDDIPLLLHLLIEMGVPEQIDAAYSPHGNRDGLSVGWVATVWLVYILTEQDHRMCYVREWVNARRQILSDLIGQPIRNTDFTDDRLADVLRDLSGDEGWHQVEAGLTRRGIRVYSLEPETIRLDATAGQVYHDPHEHTLFQVGRTQADTFDVQFKLMLGALDPLGLPVAVDVVAGNRADDPLYVPTYRRVRESLEAGGLLYVGDTKMGARETRAMIHAGGDYYLLPLARVGDTPELLDHLLTRLEAGAEETTAVYRPEDVPDDPETELDPDLAIAQGFETSRECNGEVEGEGEAVTWTERVFCVQSARQAEKQRKGLEKRLRRAEADLGALTPAPGRGKPPYREAESLQAAVDDVLDRYKVAGLLQVRLERQERQRPVRAYGDRPARVETTVRYQVHVTRRREAIKQSQRRLGWRLYATNAPPGELKLEEAVLVYRAQYICEQDFARLHGRQLGITPLYVQRDDHACGLIRLLTIALRGLVLFEYRVRRQLAEEGAELSGIYAGNPTRSTARPSAKLMLRAFGEITRTNISLSDGRRMAHLTPLTSVQKRILSLLGVPPAIYTKLVREPREAESLQSVSGFGSQPATNKGTKW